MWKIKPNSSHMLEPDVLRNLQQLLAKNTCNCKICSSYKKPLLIHYKNKQSQVTDKDLFNTIGRVSSALRIHRTQSQTFKKDLFCPGCYMAMNLCRQKDLKFLKDEESETKGAMFGCDKSTEKDIMVLEKSTSNTNKSEHKNIIVPLSEDSFDFSAVATKIDNKKLKKEPVTSLEQGTLETMPINSNCLCMANFINSIRPPLSINDIYDM